VTHLDERLAVGVEQFGREGSGTDPRCVRLGDPDDAIDVARAEAGFDDVT
jgi:hypothetical protein